MSEHWQRGDLAECIDAGDLAVPGPMRLATGGRFLRLGVEYVVYGVGYLEAAGEEVLHIATIAGPKLSRRFRKVPPVPAPVAARERELEAA